MRVQNTIFVSGKWVPSLSEARLEVVCPSTEKPIGSVPDSSAADVDQAVSAARVAFDDGRWSGRSVDDRAQVLTEAMERLEAQTEEIAQLLTSQVGAPIVVSRQLIPAALATGRYFVQLGREHLGDEIRRGSMPAAVLREPVGVVAAIAPWNGSFSLAMNKIMPALVAGCSVVFKPAPETPLDAAYIADALSEAGLPDGVLNIVTGGRDTGRHLVEHVDVDKVSFTGSTDAGREIGQACGGSFKRMQLELGGKSAAIILEDADIETAMAGLAMGSFFFTGQVCAAYSRVLAPRSRYDEIAEALCATAESFVIGDPFDESTTMGPLVSKRQRDRVEDYIAMGFAEGAKIATGGGRPSHLPTGWYIEPTVFVDASNSMRFAREEIFGPVAALIPYEGQDEAVAIANDSPYGLHGGVFTQDDEAALAVARQIRTGTFSVNSFTYNIEAPFGGVKCSGVGRDTGLEGLLSYVELKTVNLTPTMERLFAT
jgi:acyl-CoA reductase-like NAD-dependent aldehyde dehydrogenase